MEKLITVLLINLMILILFESIKDISRGNVAVIFAGATVNESWKKFGVLGLFHFYHTLYKRIN